MWAKGKQPAMSSGCNCAMTVAKKEKNKDRKTERDRERQRERERERERDTSSHNVWNGARKTFFEFLFSFSRYYCMQIQFEPMVHFLTLSYFHSLYIFSQNLSLSLFADEDFCRTWWYPNNTILCVSVCVSVCERDRESMNMSE